MDDSSREFLFSQSLEQVFPRQSTILRLNPSLDLPSTIPAEGILGLVRKKSRQTNRIVRKELPIMGVPPIWRTSLPFPNRSISNLKDSRGFLNFKMSSPIIGHINDSQLQ
jgi:hypothetical protein